MKTASPMRSLLRAISIIKSFTPKELELSGAEIARKVGIAKTTAYRILECLTENGLLEQNEKRGKYTIGRELYVQGSLYLGSTDVLKAAEPVMETLNDLTNEAVNLGILDKGNVVFIMKAESKYHFRFAIHIGSVIPAYASTMGKALLSELTEEELARLYPDEKLTPVTKKTIPTKTELKLDLEKIRKSGISFDNEGGYEGVDGIGSVIRDTTGKAIAAMSISVPVFRRDQTYRKRLETLVRLGTNLVSYRLGYQDKDYTVRDIEEIRLWWKQSKSSLQ